MAVHITVANTKSALQINCRFEVKVQSVLSLPLCCASDQSSAGWALIRSSQSEAISVGVSKLAISIQTFAVNCTARCLNPYTVTWFTHKNMTSNVRMSESKRLSDGNVSSALPCLVCDRKVRLICVTGSKGHPFV